MHYYNEFDKSTAAWLRQLISEGYLPDGVVDERSICDVQPSDLKEFVQCHFFAGIGGWPLALRLAGWPEDKPVWTGSCPCQPFSAAGKRLGTADERHLWPVFHSIIAECRPPVAFGEQVASKDGRIWLAGVRTDLEAVGYAVGASDQCAAGIGAYHIRQRIWWGAFRMADAMRCGQQGHGIMGRSSDSEAKGDRQEHRAFNAGGSGRMADADFAEQGMVGGCVEKICERAQGNARTRHRSSSELGGLADTDSETCSGRGVQGPGQGFGASSWATCERPAGLCEDRWPRPPHRFWRDADWLHCRDGKWRPVEPGTFPLADGLPARVGRLRGYGNAIVPQVAAEFIQAFNECLTQ